MRKDLFEVIYIMKKEGIRINYAKLAREYNCDYRTIKAYYERDQSLPLKRKPRNYKKLVEGYEGFIIDKFNKGSPGIAIYNFLVKKFGFAGKYGCIKEFLREHKRQKQEEATLRFETNPGLQCQIDWKESLTLENKMGDKVTVNIFLAILGFSRLKYIELTIDRSQPTLFKCLANLAHFLKGTPKQLLFDNMRTVVDRSRTQYEKAYYNEKFYSFSKDMGFEPQSCIAYRPQTKGKVETVAKIVNRLKVYNNEFESLDELIDIVNELRNEINNEIQQTIKEKPIKRFEKEKEYLNPEPNYEILEAYFNDIPVHRKVSKESLITYKERKYSVPISYIGKIVTIKECETNISIYYNNKFICKHKITNNTFNYNKNHYKEIVETKFEDNLKIDEICQQNLNIFDKL